MAENIRRDKWTGQMVKERRWIINDKRETPNAVRQGQEQLEMDAFHRSDAVIYFQNPFDFIRQAYV
jgi:hypothetical protein